MNLGDSVFRLLRRKSGSVVVLLLAGLLLIIPAHAGQPDNTTSPYLLLHADDAIDWHPWNKQTLDRARAENKLIFLSIGYASCYWCHVMARTTFVDERVIDLLNQQYVSILVDREERPDLDNHFMPIMLAMLGQTGYPANFILTPDGTPIVATGYIAPDPEYGQPGFVQAAQNLAKEWNDNSDPLKRNAKDIRGQLNGLFETVPLDEAQDQSDPRETAARQWSDQFDETYGGFGNEPKFIQSNVLSFLLRRGVRHGDQKLVANVLRTLDQIAASGVRDQLGGAFHRYAADRYWQIPHFEIMLDENAALASLYLEAYQATGAPRYAVVARGILNDLLERFQLPGGGFASTLDAETRHIEGYFYTWTANEVRSVLGAQEAEQFIGAYMDTSHSLVKGRSVLRILDDPQSLLVKQTLFEKSLSLLRVSRARREPPRRDDKVLTSWNALTISAFAKASQVLKDKRYLQVAEQEMHLLLAGTPDLRKLPHSRLGTSVSSTVFLDDYAFVIQAHLDLFETTFDTSYLDNARLLMNILIERFQEAPGMPFQFTPLDQSSIIAARTILNEETIASGNAAALISAHRLALFGGDPVLEKQTQTITQGLGRFLEVSPQGVTGLLRALDFRPVEAHEIVIVGDLKDAATQELLGEVYKRLLPGTVLAVIAPGAPKQNDKWPLLGGRPLLDDKPTAYVCTNRICDLPVDTPSELSAQLDKLLIQKPMP